MTYPSQLIQISLLIISSSSLYCLENDDPELWRSALRNLQRKARDYVKLNPISNELRSFIDRIKRNDDKRHALGRMYVVKEGEVVPLDHIEGDLHTESELGSNFTVVPLIIPIALQHNLTLREQVTDLTTVNTDPVADRARAAILGRLQASGRARQANTSFSEAETEEAVVDSLVGEKLKSKDGSDLNKMLDHVADLITTQKRGRFNKEGALCNTSGYWDTEAGGKTLHIFKNDSSQEKTSVALLDKEPPSEEGFLIHENWNITGFLPFNRSTQIILTATCSKGRKIAVFENVESAMGARPSQATGSWEDRRTAARTRRRLLHSSATC
ncbi:uncharacterized protein LOC132697749 isoform X2 [Cylas formicarius]|uniref:uncharacterized protein LOC132697749 isoform X2 n=1 Tax=Cylas formicarius TaxID=197179 RepID=UPI002958D4FB|nr:uncharacterized protein LOC132697749 isoform X2 [Cylas formicarius]